MEKPLDNKQQACVEIANLITNQVAINHYCKEMPFYIHLIKTVKSLIMPTVGEI